MNSTRIPGTFCTEQWSSGSAKRRHFVVEGGALKLFGRRGKTFKSQINLTAVSVLRPASAVEAPAGTFELQVRTLRSTLTYFLWPERNAAELFLALGNAVPSHATSDNLWATHMRSRPVAGPAEFRVGKTLGSGTFGKVKLAQRLSDGQMVAMKCLNRSRIVLAAQGERLAKEIRLLKLLNHPNVIRLHEVLHTPSEILMVMEYVPGGDLLEVLNTQPRFAEGQVRHIFGQICRGVAFCHSLGVAHRDLKPENVLIVRRLGDPPERYQIKVADFGLSTLMQAGELLSTSCGSPHYVAPEILDFDGTARYNGRESDVWSLGVILHVLLCYKLPFEAESTALLYKKIRLGLETLPARLSVAATELVHAMLEVQPDLRISLDQVMLSRWLSLEVEPPSFSLMVHAVVDYEQAPPASDTTAASAAWPLIAPARLRPGWYDTGSRATGIEAEQAPTVRRAFTFDTLPLYRSCEYHLGASPPRAAPVNRRPTAAEPARLPQPAPLHAVSRHLASKDAVDINGVDAGEGPVYDAGAVPNASRHDMEGGTNVAIEHCSRLRKPSQASLPEQCCPSTEKAGEREIILSIASAVEPPTAPAKGLTTAREVRTAAAAGCGGASGM